MSDVSFKTTLASLQAGKLPEPGDVRSEEFLNALEYRDPMPRPGEPLAFHWERARSPFTHDRDIIRFSVRTAALGRQPGRAINLVCLLDNSGSMEREDRVSIVQQALGVLARKLTPNDRVSLVTFSRTPKLRIDGMRGGNREAFLKASTGWIPQGGTHVEKALALAYETAKKHFIPGGNNRVVLLTDGAANMGNVDPYQLRKTVESHRKQGIALDCFGIGWEGYNDNLLEVLARNGDGRYGFLNQPAQAVSEFEQKLLGAFQVAASDVKVQVEWNADRVRVFRQVGYLRHQFEEGGFPQQQDRRGGDQRRGVGQRPVRRAGEPGRPGAAGRGAGCATRCRSPASTPSWSGALPTSNRSRRWSMPDRRCGWAVLRRPLPSGWRRTRTRRACSWPICRG